MKKYKYNIIMPLFFSTLIYLIISFGKWDILWIKEISKWKESDRFFSISIYVVFNLGIQSFVQIWKS